MKQSPIRLLGTILLLASVGGCSTTDADEEALPDQGTAAFDVGGESTEGASQLAPAALSKPLPQKPTATTGLRMCRTPEYSAASEHCHKHFAYDTWFGSFLCRISNCTATDTGTGTRIRYDYYIYGPAL